MPHPKLAIHGLDETNQRRRQVEGLNSVFDHSFDDSRTQTAAEKLAGVTPVNKAYAPGDVRRYGAVGDDAFDCTRPFQDAIDQSDEDGGADVYIPRGTFRITSALTGVRGLKMTGAGRFRTTVRVIGAINFYTFTGSRGNPDGGSHTFRDFTIKGSGASDNLIELVTAGQNLFEGMQFWLSGSSMVVLEEQCHNTHFRDCLFRTWKTAAIHTLGSLNSIISGRGLEFSIVGQDLIDESITMDAGSSCILLGSGEQLSFKDLNVNGDTEVDHVVRITAELGRLQVAEVYAEHVVGPCIKNDTGAVVLGANIRNCQLSCTDSVSIDLSNGDPNHTGIIVRNIRRPQSGAVFILSVGTGVVDYDYSGIGLEAGADHVVEVPGYRHVRRYFDGRLDVNGNPSTAVTTLENYTFDGGFLHFNKALITGGTLTPAQITADQNDYEPTGFLTNTVIRLSSDASRNITGLGRDGSSHLKWLVNVGAQDIVLVHNSGSSAANKRLQLPGGANVTVTPGHSVMIYYDGVQDMWRMLAGTQT